MNLDGYDLAVCVITFLNLNTWNIKKINIWNSGLITSAKNTDVILQFQSLPWQLLSIVFAEVGRSLCWILGIYFGGLRELI